MPTDPKPVPVPTEPKCTWPWHRRYPCENRSCPLHGPDIQSGCECRRGWCALHSSVERCPGCGVLHDKGRECTYPPCVSERSQQARAQIEAAAMSRLASMPDKPKPAPTEAQRRRAEAWLREHTGATWADSVAQLLADERASALEEAAKAIRELRGRIVGNSSSMRAVADGALEEAEKDIRALLTKRGAP